MRKIAILGLLLATSLPTQTTAMEVRSFGEGGSFDVYGDFSNYSQAVGAVGFTFSASPFTAYDYETQSPFEWYHISVRAPQVDVEIYACNEWDAHCGRSNANYNDVLFLYGVNGVGHSWVSGSGEGNVQVSVDVNVTLFDGFSFNAPAIPEPSTWALLIIGFAILVHKRFRLA